MLVIATVFIDHPKYKQSKCKWNSVKCKGLCTTKRKSDELSNTVETEILLYVLGSVQSHPQ